MRASAPGKLVLSGAYAVLEGAPALVAAVDRYALAADDGRRPPVLTEEVAEAQRRGLMGEAPWFDADALRDDGRKLGLGSSAAILAASMVVAGYPDVDDARLAEAVFPDALAVHRAAQGGGSGVDVAAACYGGVICCELQGASLKVTPHVLPEGLCTQTFACPVSASTRAMLAALRDYRSRDEAGYVGQLARAAEGARAAVRATSVDAFVSALSAQFDAFAALGTASGIAIVTESMAALDREARSQGGCFGPSGAGGGDVAVYYGPVPPPPSLVAAARTLGLNPVALRLGAPGLRRERSG